MNSRLRDRRGRDLRLARGFSDMRLADALRCGERDQRLIVDAAAGQEGDARSDARRVVLEALAACRPVAIAAGREDVVDLRQEHYLVDCGERVGHGVEGAMEGDGEPGCG